MGEFMPATMLTLVSVVILTISQFVPPSRGAVIAFFPREEGMAPIWQAIEDTDAYLVRGSRIPGAIVLYSDQNGFPERLRHAGATMVVNYLGAEWCGSSQDLPSFVKRTS